MRIPVQMDDRQLAGLQAGAARLLADTLGPQSERLGRHFAGEVVDGLWVESSLAVTGWRVQTARFDGSPQVPQRDCVVDTNGVVYPIDMSTVSIARYPTADSPFDPVELPVYGLLEGIVELFEITTGKPFPGQPAPGRPNPPAPMSGASGISRNPFAGIVDDIRQDVEAHRRSEDLANTEALTRQARIDAAWKQTERNLSVVSKEVAEICRGLGIRPQRTTSTFRGWVFRVAGNTISVGRMGGWKRISDRPNTVLSNLYWSSSEPLSIDNLRSMLKPQIAERARGTTTGSRTGTTARPISVVTRGHLHRPSEPRGQHRPKQWPPAATPRSS